MYQMATCLGIDGTKYTYSMNRNTDNGDVQSNDVIMTNENAVVKCFAREGINFQCYKCKAENKFNKIDDKDTNLLTILSCSSVSII